MRSGSTLRATGLMTAGALAVHHLRYLTAPHEISREASSAHAYLGVVAPLVIAAVFLTGVHLVSLVLRAREGHEVPTGRASFRRTWLLATAGLLAIFVAQELAEGVFAEGHPDALEVFHHGGLAVFPIAAGVGAIVALCLRGAHAVIAEAARRARRAACPRRSADLPAPPRAVYPPRRPALTGPGAGRAPPLLSV